MSSHLNEPKTQLFHCNDDGLPQLVISSTYDGAVSTSIEKNFELSLDESFEVFYSYDAEDEPSENMPIKKPFIPSTPNHYDTLKKLENLSRKLTEVTITSNDSKNILTTSRASNNNCENRLNQCYYKRSNLQVIDPIKNKDVIYDPIESHPVETVDTIPKIENKDNSSSELISDDFSFASSTEIEACNETKEEIEEVEDIEEAEEVEEERIPETTLFENFEEKVASTTSHFSHQESIAIKKTSDILNDESSQNINTSLLAQSLPFSTVSDQPLEGVLSEDPSVTPSTYSYCRWYDSEIIKDRLKEKRLRELDYEERELTIESSERIDRLYNLGKKKQIQRRIIDRKIQNKEYQGKTINPKTVNESARLTNLYYLGKHRQTVRREIEQKQKLQQNRPIEKSPNKQDKHDVTIIAGNRLYNKSQLRQQRGKELREEVRKTREKAAYADWYSNLHPAPFVNKI